MLSFLMMLALAWTTEAHSTAASGPSPKPALTVVSATGIGYPPRHMHGAQAGLMAHRAAEVVAIRNLAAKLGLPSIATMGAFRYVAIRNLSGGAVEVTVETTVNTRATYPSPPGNR